ncbi:MAG: PilX N-terminal domain-containing pilus assembly protein [Phycisphaerales bacterium JB043]
MACSSTVRHRATVLVISTIILAMLSMSIAIAVSATGDDARVSMLRFESLKAFYAAESGVQAAIRQQIDDGANPLSTTTTLPNGAVYEITDPFDATPAAPGALKVEGRTTIARRTVSVVAQ